MLEKTSLSISLEDHDAMKQQYEERLRNAENRIYSLVKEHDALLRTSAQDLNMSAIIKEKDEIIEEVGPKRGIASSGGARFSVIGDGRRTETFEETDGPRDSHSQEICKDPRDRG